MNEFGSHPESLRSTANQVLGASDHIGEVARHSDWSDPEIFGTDSFGTAIGILVMDSDLFKSVQYALQALPGLLVDHGDRYRTMADTNEASERKTTVSVRDLGIRGDV